jgi:hypothetical protein
MNFNDYKDSIIVGVLFLLFTRDWFDNLIFGTFPSLKGMPWVYLGLKVLAIMLLFYLLQRIINISN